MSADGSCELVWGGDERRFRLGIAELFALQERRDAGPMEILRRLRTEAWRIEDVIEVIRLGLIGAGVDAKVAKALIDFNITPPNITEHAIPATAILMSALLGAPKELVGKTEATKTTPETTVSPSSPSTAPVLN